ncbi:hypothetical protein D3C80_1510530 [compost metagenome]
MQREILRLFHFALRKGGYRFLGSSESADVAADLFIAVDKRHRIFRAREMEPARRPGRLLTPDTQAARAKPKPLRKLSYAEIHHRALSRRTPPSLIVDGDGNILHMSDGVGRFSAMPVAKSAPAC